MGRRLPGETSPPFKTSLLINLLSVSDSFHVQETHLDARLAPEFGKRFPSFSSFFSNHSSNKRGIASLSRATLSPSLVSSSTYLVHTTLTLPPSFKYSYQLHVV